MCPCGTGKKIKFCCPDLLQELEKIDRMLEGEQNRACVQYIEQLQKTHPDRACLMALKGPVLRVLGQLDEAVANAKAFAEKHPVNATALAELAIVTAFQKGGREAMPIFQQAMARSEDGIGSAVYEAMSVLAQVLIAGGQYLAARALLQLMMAVSAEDNHPVELLVSLNRSPHVPLVMKDDPPLGSAADGVPWKARLDDALQPIQTGTWQESERRLTPLADEVADSPLIWRNLATVRGWLADDAGCAAALRKCAALGVPEEDAVEAIALAMLLAENPLQDAVDVLALEWTVEDVETLLASLTIDKRTLPLPVDRVFAAEDDSPPPRGAYILLDRPMAESAGGLDLENAPSFLGQVMVFGRQTDREARLELIGVTSSDRDKARTLIGELAGRTLGAEGPPKVISTVSASQELLESKIRPPADSTPQELERLMIAQRRRALLVEWPDLKLGVLGGKSPREAAGEPPLRNDLLAAILLLEMWCEPLPGAFDFNELRTALGLPALGPIDPEQLPIDDVPLVRMRRVMVEKLSDEDLLYGYRRTVAYTATAALREFARAVVDRPSLSGKDEQLMAYMNLARTEESLDRALEYVDRGRAATESLGRSPASWLLLELQFRFARGEAAEVSRLVQRLQTRHFREPGVADALMRFLVQIGAIRPDGSPAGAGPDALGEPGPAQGAEPGKLWVPGGETAGGGGKIWTPD
jgi:tetratricopeptide (TPR) repeat protein